MDHQPESSENTFDPDGVGRPNENIFALPHTFEEAKIVLLPVPWDVTTSYKAGTSNGPETILKASVQLDLSDPVYGCEIWKYGVHLLEAEDKWKSLNDALRPVAESCINWQENEKEAVMPEEITIQLETVNRACETLREWVNLSCAELLNQGKMVGIVGGEHSVPLGLLQALGDRYESVGILQIDAHADLRETYGKFKHSHASVFHNALNIKALKSLVQVGLRDVAPVETDLINNDPRLHGFPDWHLRQALFSGMDWQELCDQIIDKLPEYVYVSFDIDGLDPSLCPNTGTPVPGGLSFNEAIFLLQRLVASGRKIIGFDLCEVAPSPDQENEWDGNVGARMLFHLCNAMYASQQG